jgi:hypothetical protein
MIKIKRKNYRYLSLFALTAALSACGGNDNGEHVVTVQPHVYEVTLLNITQGQIFSPPALTTHTQGLKLWQAGETASFALEALAESGDSSQLIALSGITTSQVSNAPVMPGDMQTWTLELAPSATLNVSLATMLINTNDGFTGFTDMDLSAIALGESYHKMLVVYDAGTEMNDEVALPGSGGEAFNASRAGDVDRVYAHAGVLTSHELSSSVLLTEHKFDNPVAKLIIKRMQ